MNKILKAAIVILIIIGLIAGGFLGYKFYTEKQAKKELSSVEKYTVSKGDLSLVSIGSGKIVSADVKTVIPSGTLNEINVKVGDIVKKDTLLAKYTDFKGQKLDLLSEYEGVITAIPVASSSALAKATSAFEISLKTSLQLDIQITEKEIFKIKKDQKATVYIEALGKEYNGLVKRISYAGNTDKDFTIYTVTVSVEGANDDIYLGMTGSAKISIENKTDVYKAPVEAVIEDNGKRYLLKSEWQSNPAAPKKDYYIEVTTGLSDTDFVEIVSGITQETEIIIPQNDESKYPSFFRNPNQTGGGTK